MDLNGHEAGNGGYSQGKSKVHRVSSTRRRRIVQKLGFRKLGVAHKAATRCLDGTKLDRHEYILTSPGALPELDVSWG